MGNQRLRDSRVRIIYATPVLRHPPISGPTLRVENTIKALNRISELFVYSRVCEKLIGGKAAVSFFQRQCKRFFFAPHLGRMASVRQLVRRGVNCLIKRVFGQVYFQNVHGPLAEDFADIVAIAKRLRVDLIWLGYGNISYPLLRYIKTQSSFPVVLDTDSVWSRFVLRELPYVENEEERARIEREGKAKEDEERWGTALADITTAVSEVDADYYRNLASSPGRVRLFSNVIDMESYRDLPARDVRMGSPNIYLAGTFWVGSPMEKAARWVLNDVWPALRQTIPDVEFHIVGKNSDKVLHDIVMPGVIVHGQLPSVLPLLGYADVVLVPLQFESGTRFKILEAGACERPVVSTTLGAEGIPVTHGKDILIADTATAFVNAIIKILSDPKIGYALGSELRKLVEDQFSLKRLEAEGQEILTALVGGQQS